jgi:twitching motility protein PilT
MKRGPRARMEQLLHRVITDDASDLHLRSNEPPILRRHGRIERVADAAILESDDILAMVSALMPERQRTIFDEKGDADFAHEIPFLARFRINVLRERSGVAAVFRRIPPRILTADELGLAPALRQLCALRKGLVLVTGPTGSGKSTTLAAMVDLVNETRAEHIVTIEDPIEFAHQSKRCIVTQREVGEHTESFKTALRAALREDPDVVLIGEMRDLETVAIALETAETGHLVFASLHTTTAASTVDRIIDQFPPEQQEQIRVMFAASLRAVIAQTLCRRVGGGRVAAREVLINTKPVANLIRERKVFQLASIMQTSKRLGMVTLTDALVDLVAAGEVDAEEAYSHATERAAFLAALRAKGIGTVGLEEPDPEESPRPLVGRR